MTIVVVGGGIAGVSCSEELSRLNPGSAIHLVSGSPLIKAVTNFTRVSQVLEQFDVIEQPLSYITQRCPNVTIHHAKLTSLSVTCRTAQLSDGGVLKYDRICLCTGARPTLIVEGNPLVLGLRDVESAQELRKRLQGARRVVVVGNGGIATELVYVVGGCEVLWAIKDRSIGHTFFDEGAAVFFLPHLVSETTSESLEPSKHVAAGDPSAGHVTEISPLKRLKYALDKRPGPDPSTKEGGWSKGTAGGALGPDWHSDLKMTGKAFDENSRRVHVEYACEVKEILTQQEFAKLGIKATPFPSRNKVTRNEPATPPSMDSCEEAGSGTSCQVDSSWALYVALTNGNVFGCDFVVSATGVTPNAGGLEVEGGTLDLAGEDGGVKVDREMRTNIACVYAAGDVCSTQWDHHSNLWFQMRLWTQARQMGCYAAQCITAHSRGEEITLDFCFELFSHVTTFFGYKVVLLGLFNGQTLENDYEIHLRCSRGLEYVKIVVRDGRLVGAVLIGETDLEETFENLILNQMDISQFDLLDPRVDLEDFFD